MNKENCNSRRSFIETLALGSAIGGLTAFSGGVVLAETNSDSKILNDAEEWFKGIKGTHRIVYDGSTPHDGFPIIWNWAFYLTNNQTDVPDSDMTAMTVLRHSAIPFAMNSSVWKKYKLGTVYGINDPKTQQPSERNPFYAPTEGDFPIPAIQGIKDLQARGAMFCVCDLAMNFYSGVIAGQMGLEAANVYSDFKAAVEPGIQIVPSGVWALQRAQKHGCAYVFAGG